MRRCALPRVSGVERRPAAHPGAAPSGARGDEIAPMNHPPVVLVFGGTDPTSGAGVQADILTVTAQDTSGIKEFALVEPELVVAQARAILEDMPVAAIKTGMLGSRAVVGAVANILDDYPNIPLVVDPVQVSGRGDALADESLDEALRTLLLPRAQLLTPHSFEA